MTRKLGSAVLAISVLSALISLVVKGGIGVSQAGPVGSPEFNLTGAKVEITHETATDCLDSNFVSCTQEFNETATNVSIIACTYEYSCSLLGNRFDSDSYQILANLALTNPNDFQQELNQTIEFALAPGNCTGIFPGLSPVPPGTWIGTIPGASLQKTGNRLFNLYTFDGNIPSVVSELNDSIFPLSSALFDNLQFSLFIPKFGQSTMFFQGNADLCAINGPMALAVLIRDSLSCVNIPAPHLNTLDVSSAVCSNPSIFP
jgi:hypothetical protein